MLKKVPEKEWADKLRQTFNTSGEEKIQVEQGIFADGDNKYIDKLVFKKGDFDPYRTHSIPASSTCQDSFDNPFEPDQLLPGIEESYFIALIKRRQSKPKKC